MYSWLKRHRGKPSQSSSLGSVCKEGISHVVTEYSSPLFCCKCLIVCPIRGTDISGYSFRRKAVKFNERLELKSSGTFSMLRSLLDSLLCVFRRVLASNLENVLSVSVGKLHHFYFR